ncbi:hypothetical protein BDV95DRAFT_78691 [Massariosphaeria phaeospora]|uniref:Uncharacterized protein n=1 Tax=Massariosphaeria phaeospora TaxID=100035 RepID=A0A7C8I7S5_9PLEO|nr:hypothetical protein BDV95DRAFT_78691 [Massariosphaeria phaeospora]
MCHDSATVSGPLGPKFHKPFLIVIIVLCESGFRYSREVSRCLAPSSTPLVVGPGKLCFRIPQQTFSAPPRTLIHISCCSFVRSRYCLRPADLSLQCTLSGQSKLQDGSSQARPH